AETPAPTQVALQTRPSAPERPAAPTRRGISIISSAQADELGPGATPFHPLYVQVGAFSDGQNAAKLVDRLKRGGFANSFVLTAGQGADRIHRVRIGPLENEAHFDRVRADLRAVGVYESRLVQDN
ncbi:MAG: SPOR domain-containing protein, partial [Gammaproteobacteria bacterium]